MTELERRLKKAKEKEQPTTAANPSTGNAGGGDLARRLRIAKDARKEYSLPAEHRRAAMQNKTESLLDRTTVGEDFARADIDRYRAQQNAEYYSRLAEAGQTYRDPSMIDRSRAGFVSARKAWSQAYDEAARAQVRESNKAHEQPITHVGEAVELANRDRRYLDFWRSMQQSAQRFGDEGRDQLARENFGAAMRSAEQSVGQVHDAVQKEAEAMEQMRQTNFPAYAALTMREEDIQAQIDRLNDTRTQERIIKGRLANDEEVMFDYWHRTPAEQKEYENNLRRARYIGETDAEHDAYVRSERDAYQDAVDRMMQDAYIDRGNGDYSEGYNQREIAQAAVEKSKKAYEDALAIQRFDLRVPELQQKAQEHPEMVEAGRSAMMAQQRAIEEKYGLRGQKTETTSGSHRQTRRRTVTFDHSAYIDSRTLQQMKSEGYVLKDMWQLTEEEKTNVYMLYNENPQLAQQMAQRYIDQHEAAYYRQFYDWANKDSGWQFGRRLVANVAGTAAKLASGLDPYGTVGQSASRLGEAFVSGGAASASRNGLFGIEFLGGDESGISKDIPFLGGGRAGEAYQLGASMLESAAIAVPSVLIGRYDMAGAKVAGFLGTALMGSSAAADDYRQCVSLGMSDDQAKAHATATGIAEAAFEYISLDKLIDPGEVKSALKRWLIQGGIEASEEVCTTIANRISDTLHADYYNIENSIERRVRELEMSGEAPDKARDQAKREWLSDVMMDGLGGFFSGLIMGGGADMIRSGKYHAAQSRYSAEQQTRGGVLMAGETSAFGNAEAVDAVRAFAMDRGMDADALDRMRGKVRGAEVDAAMEALRGTGDEETGGRVSAPTETRDEGQRTETGDADSSTPLRSAQNDEQGTRGTDSSAPLRFAQNDKNNDGLDDRRNAARVSRREMRRVGEFRQEVGTLMAREFEGKTVAEQQEVYDGLVQKYGPGIKSLMDSTIVEKTARSYLSDSSTVEQLDRYHKGELEQLQDGDYKMAAMRGYDTARSMLEARDYRTTDERLRARGNLETEVSYTDNDGNEVRTQISGVTNKGKTLVLANGETRGVNEVNLSADTKDAIRVMNRLSDGLGTGMAFREYLDYVNDGGTQGYEFAKALSLAFNQGRESAIERETAVQMAPSFAQNAAGRAFDAGAKLHAETVQAGQAARTKAEAAARARGAGTVTGSFVEKGLGTDGKIDWSRINKHRRAQAIQQAQYVEKISSAIGADVVLVQSDTKRGKDGRRYYTGAQGAWDIDYSTGKPVIQIDVNAGANYVSDLNAALIATTGHELAHHFQRISPAVYDEYRSAVLKAIVSTQNGYAKLQRMIEEEIRKNRAAGLELTREQAEDEVVANASRDRLGDQNLWKNVAGSLTDTTRGKVAQWLYERFRKIFKATKRYAGFEAADLVLQSAQEYQDLIGELWQKLATQAANAVDVRSEDYTKDPDAYGTKKTATEGGKKFMMREAVEQTDRLIAWHNMSEEALRSALELGGLAMPSWAIKTADRAHTSYGTVSVIAPRNLIDPKMNRNSMIFGGDAWTPVFPGVDYDVTYESAKKLEDEIKGLVGEETYNQIGGAALDHDNISSALSRTGGALPGHYSDSLLMKYAYLKSIGKDVTLPQTGERLDAFGYFSNEEVEQFVNRLVSGKLSLDRFRKMSTDELMQQEDLKAAMAQIREEYYREKLGNNEAFEKLKSHGFFSKDFTFSKVDAMLRAAELYFRNNGIKQTIDKRAAQEAIDKEINKADFEKWALNKLNSAVVKKGIRNDKDTFTPSGNRRSFDALHYAYNLANIVKAMKSQPKQGRTQFLSGPGSVKGAALKSYNTVDQVRKDRGRLVDSAEEGKAAYDAYNRNLEDILDRMSKNGDRFDAADALIEVFQHAKTEAAIYNYMQRELKDWYNISRELAHDAYELIGQINALPMEYFEGKTYDAVTFDETAAVVVPDTMDAELKNQLADAGANVLEYKAGDDEDRLEKVNSVDGAKFSARSVEETDAAYMDAVQRGDMETAQRMVDEAAKLTGYDMHLYHGSKGGGGFTKFKNWSYFTESKLYAEKYQDRANKSSLYSVFGKSDRMFDTRKKPDARIFEKFRNEYGMSPLQETGLPDWTDGGDIIDFIEENGYDYDGIALDEGTQYFPGAKSYEDRYQRVISYVIKNSSQLKSADPITYDDSGNVIPLSERFNPKNEDIRYSQRDYGQVSDLDVVESLDEKKATTPEGKRLVKELQGYAERVRTLEARLAKLQGELKQTDRALNTRGIVKFAKGMLREMGMSNDYYRDLDGWVSRKITEIYRAALDAMDRTGDIGAASDALYKGAKEIADFLLENAGYHENHGGTWMRAKWASQFAQEAAQREQVKDDIFAKMIMDYSENRHRAPAQETEADRIARRAAKPVQKKLDETAARLNEAQQANEALTAQNRELTGLYEQSRDYAEYLREYAQGLQQEIKDAKQSGKLDSKRIASLQQRLSAAKKSASAWAEAQKRTAEAGARTASKYNREIEGLQKQIQHQQDIIAGKIQNREIQRMIRDAKEAAVKKERERKDAQFARSQEKRNERDLRERIQRHASDLEQKLLKPSDKRHIPEQYRMATTALLNAINRESGYDYDPDTLHTTSRGATVGKRVEKGKGTATKRTQAFLALKEALQRIAAEDGFTGELLDFDGDGSGLISQALALGDVPISRMNMEQLGTIWQTVRALEHNITNFNRAFAAGRTETISGIADKFRTDTEGRKPRQRDAKNALDAKLMKLFSVTKFLENPYTFFDHYGESGHEMFRRLRDAQDLIQVRGDYIAEVWLGEMRNALGVTGTDEKVRKAVEDFVEKTDKAVEVFTLASGQKLTLTHSMMMDIWLLSQRAPTGLNHLLGSGVIQPKIEVKGHYTTRDATFRHLTIEDIQEIGSRLTEQEKATAKAMQVVQRQLAKWGNEASMTVYGYRKFTEENYWPVKNAREENRSESGQDNGRQPTGTMNKGMARSLKPNAATGTEPVSAFRQMQGSISDMLTYSTWGPTLEDMNRVFNYKYKDESGATVTTVKSLVDQYGGEGSQRYWADLAKHISVGMGSSDNPIAAGIGKAVGAVKGARVAFNARVVAQQPTAYSRAAEVIDHKYLVASLADLKSWSPGAKSAWNRALEHSPTARRKDSTTYDMGGSIRNDKALGLEKASAAEKFTDVGTALAGKADALTWGRLWHAAELQISAKTDLEKGSAEYYDAVNKLFTEAVDRTQVMDGILQRPAIMRMNSDFVKGMTAYMGEPLMQVNMLMRQATSWKQVGWKVAKKAMFRTASGLLLSQLINAMVQSVFDATFRRTDEDKDWWERFLAEMSGIDGTEKSAFDRITGVLLGGNLASELGYLNKIPGINDLLSLIEGYDPGNDRFDLAAAKDLINAAKLLSNDKYTGWHKAKELVSKMTMLFGVGVGNALRDIYGAAHNFVFDNLGPRAKFDFKAIWLNPESKQNRRQYFDLLWQMLENGDKEGFHEYAKKQAGSDKDVLSYVKTEAKEKHLDGELSFEDLYAMLAEAGGNGEYIAKVMSGVISDRFYAQYRPEKKYKDIVSAGMGISEEEAILLLQKWGGKDEKKAWNTVQKWAARAAAMDADGEVPNDFEWSIYQELTAAIAQNKDIDGILSEFRAHGYTDAQLNTAVRDGIKEALWDDVYSEDAAIDALIRYGVKYTEKGKTKTYDEDSAWKKVHEWVKKSEHLDEDGHLEEGYSYSEYDKLREAIRTGTGIEAERKTLLDHGYTAKQVNDETSKAIKTGFESGEISEKDAIGLLKKYVTYTNDKEAVPHDDNSAWKKVHEWQTSAAHTDEEGNPEDGYSYTEYGEIYDAIDRNADISNMVDELARHNENPDKKRKDILDKVKTRLVDNYVAGKTTSESALKNQLSRYCKITKTEDVEKIVNTANCKRATGYALGDLNDAYRDGEIDTAKLKQALVRYGGQSSADAEKTVRWLDLQKANPSLDISKSRADTWYDGTSKSRENGHGSARAAGMSIEKYLEAKEILADVTGMDRNGDGKSDQYTKEAAWIQAISGMSGLTSEQRWALYYEEYKGANWTKVRRPNW